MTPVDVVQAVATRLHCSGSLTAPALLASTRNSRRADGLPFEFSNDLSRVAVHLWLGKYQRDGLAGLADHPTGRLLSQVTQAWLGVLFSASQGRAGSGRAWCRYPGAVRARHNGPCFSDPR